MLPHHLQRSAHRRGQHGYQRCFGQTVRTGHCGHRGVPHAGGHGHQLLCRFLKCGFRFGRHMRGLRRVGRSLRARKTPCVPGRQHDFVRMSGAAWYPQAAAFRDESFRRIDGDRFAHADDLLRGGGYSHVQLGAERYV